MQQSVQKLGEVEVTRGMTVNEVCRKLDITKHSMGVAASRWVKLEAAKHLNQLKKENLRLKELLADKELHRSILTEVSEGSSKVLQRGQCIRVQTGQVFSAWKARILGKPKKFFQTVTWLIDKFLNFP